jgi:Arc/MetJ-type ribon-helix-helix transcriptional regulator
MVDAMKIEDRFHETTSKLIKKTRETIDRSSEKVAEVISKALREKVLMVRVDVVTLRKIDALVTGGVFKSRSECAAFLIGEGLKTQKELLTRMEGKLKEINKLKQELREMAKGKIGTIEVKKEVEK